MATKEAVAPGSAIGNVTDGIHRRIENVSEAAHPAVEHIASGAHQAVERIGGAANHAVDAIVQSGARVREAQTRFTESCRDQVRQSPLATVGAAVAVGALIGWFWRQR
jgi:ElaB/YqjD/DUF883 family membrane-anchored ribosome-binding protein